jgi:hypothetical protein
MESGVRGGSVPPMVGGGAVPLANSVRSGSGSRRATRGDSVACRGWQDTSYEAYAKRRAKRKDDLDNQWTVEEGVAPVLEATSDPDDHNATSGVIGLDR